jgi:hypothetical protein
VLTVGWTTQSRSRTRNLAALGGFQRDRRALSPRRPPRSSSAFFLSHVLSNDDHPLPGGRVARKLRSRRGGQFVCEVVLEQEKVPNSRVVFGRTTTRGSGGCRRGPSLRREEDIRLESDPRPARSVLPCSSVPSAEERGKPRVEEGIRDTQGYWSLRQKGPSPRKEIVVTFSAGAFSSSEDRPLLARRSAVRRSAVRPSAHSEQQWDRPWQS